MTNGDWENFFMRRAIKQGEDKAKRDFVLKLLKFGRMSVEEIAEMAGFSVEDVKLLQKEAVQ